MNAEYLALMRLSNNPDYKVLEAIWLHHLNVIEKSRDNAAQKGSETAWRYHAGQEKGAKRIVTALQAAILDMEAKEEGLAEEHRYDTLLSEIKGEVK